MKYILYVQNTKGGKCPFLSTSGRTYGCQELSGSFHINGNVT